MPTYQQSPCEGQGLCLPPEVVTSKFLLPEDKTEDVPRGQTKTEMIWGVGDTAVP